MYESTDIPDPLPSQQLHALLNQRAVGVHARWPEPARRGEAGGQARGLVPIQLRRVGMVVVLSSGFCAPHSRSLLHHIQVQLQNATLAENPFRQRHQCVLDRLAHEIALRGEE